MDPLLATWVRVALALLFFVTVAHKLRDWTAFEATVAAYRLAPDRGSPLLACAAVAAEASTAVALVWSALPTPGGRVASLAACAAVIALMAVYAAAIGVNLVRGRRDLDCGCVGPAARPQPIAPWLLARNAAVAGFALVMLAPTQPRTLHWLDAVSLVGGTLVIAGVWVAVHGLAAANFARTARTSGALHAARRTA